MYNHIIYLSNLPHGRLITNRKYKFPAKDDQGHPEKVIFKMITLTYKNNIKSYQTIKQVLFPPRIPGH